MMDGEGGAKEGEEKGERRQHEHVHGHLRASRPSNEKERHLPATNKRNNLCHIRRVCPAHNWTWDDDGRSILSKSLVVNRSA